jgi:acyl carrier protein
MTNDRFYKTGDLTRWLPNSNIEFLGRIDNQVKIRGFRIELGEIENQLLKLDEVKEAVVLAKEDNTGEKFLCAYILNEKELDHTGLRYSLSQALPDFMVPSYFVHLDKIPLTPNGKVDRKALPEPGLRVKKNYVAPRNEIEKQLVKIWAQILGRDASHASQLHESIGINDNFFEIGGHSLKATRLTARLHKTFNVQVPLVSIFEIPTIKELAEYIRTAVPDRSDLPEIKEVEKKEYYPLSLAQLRIYMIQQINPQITAYNISSVQVVRSPIDRNKFEELSGKSSPGMRSCVRPSPSLTEHLSREFMTAWTLRLKAAGKPQQVL